MKVTLRIIILIFTISFIYGCGDNNYIITEDYISGKSKNDGFTIAELFGDKSSQEKQRVCIETISGKKDLKQKIYFNKKNEGYQWFYCTLDLRFVENDSLKNLKVEEKLEIIQKENIVTSHPQYYETIPIEFKPGTWYHFFGFEDIEGSFYVFVMNDRSFKVEYFDGGPF